MSPWLKLFGSLLLVAACQAPSGAQSNAPAPEAVPGLFASFERRIDAIPLMDSAGHPYRYPFLGGLDRPRPQLADIDGDGDLDLFIQEYSGRMTFFERVDTTGPPRWVWRTDDWHELDIGDWSRFVDVDSDGDLDVLAEERYSYIRWYRNDGGPKTPRFTLAADTVRDVAGDPIFADRQNIPQLADLDCNGRLDLFLGRVDGTITRFELRSIDPATGPRFAFVTERFEGIQILGGDAAPGGPLPIPGQMPGAPGPTLHGANTMAVVDVDGDGDQDILWGDFFEAGLLWIRNDGTCRSPSLRAPPIPFPAGDPIQTSGYNAPTLGDLDGDGDLDLVVGVLGGAYNPTRTARDNLFLLEQTAPGVYTQRTERLLDGLDLGSESIPALVDLDGDGDLDLVVGNKIDPEADQSGGLYRFENRGTAAAPSFHAAGTLDVAPAYHYAPAFGDLDGDGDPDLVLGTWRDELAYYRNDGTRAEPRFVPTGGALVRLTRGSHATPTLGDLDGDGDLDLLVGEASGAVNYYRNDGTRQAPNFVLVSDEWQGIAGARRTVPRLVDLDGDGDLDLVIGTEGGAPTVYRNTGSPDAPAFTRDASTPVWPPYSAPAFGDLDGDGDLDLLLGNASGGLLHLDDEK